MAMNDRYDEAAAWSLDEQCPLARFRERFYRQDEAVYLDGNSLGLLSTETEAAVVGALEAWKRHGVRGWLDADPPWFTLGETRGERMAPLVGPEPASVVAVRRDPGDLGAHLPRNADPAGLLARGRPPRRDGTRSHQP